MKFKIRKNRNYPPDSGYRWTFLFSIDKKKQKIDIFFLIFFFLYIIIVYLFLKHQKIIEEVHFKDFISTSIIFLFLCVFLTEKFFF